MIQAAVSKSGFFWHTNGMAAVTEPVNGIYIVPLVAEGYMSDPAEMAVRAPGVRAELTLEMDGRSYPLIADEKQDDWFEFHFDREIERDTGSLYSMFVENNEFMLIDRENVPETAKPHGTFRFTSYNADDSIAAQAAREF